MKKFVRILTLTISFAISMTVWFTGSASAAGIPWEKNVVYVVNQAPGWPVKQAAENIDNGSKLDLRVVKTCPKGKQCIYVKAVGNIPGNPIGMTNSMQTDIHLVSSIVRLENSTLGKRNKLGLTCHEIGHAVGLNHSNAKTCMQPAIGWGTPTTINKAERKILSRWYN